ncbi:hypothetical protein [Streptomyces sp. PSKA30]|uniref:hypothetical protein n=1 Tax=Streptomyces sp. PSKA30 TaxID=2874597 RepID=UPI001CD0DA73|nr:hypothetical protein [Streptomyces sp. PSKA30]MBZ9637957.1 hypothetical protein [Streptomyces sp. PSKA30]
MRALPARRIATSALCAALLVGITGPAALAADSTREHSRVLSPEVRPSGADALIAQVRAYNRGELAPVADLLRAALEADNGQLSAAEARKLGAAAKRALDNLTDDELDALDGELDDEELDDEELDDEELDDAEEAVDDLLEAVSEDLDDVLSQVDDLLTEVEELIDSELLVTDPPAVSTLPSTSTSTSVPAEPAVTLPAVTPVLLTAP